MIFDLHCDTLLELSEKGGDLENSACAVNLSDMKKADRFFRLFAVFTPDELKGEDAKNHFDRLYSVFKKQMRLFENRIEQIYDFENIDKVCCGAVLSVENASVLAGSLDEISRLSNLGVKVMSFTWNGENELGFGQLKNKGLKAFGKECIPVAEQNGIVLDVSHLSDKGFEDVCCFAKKPFIASHSNARRICNHKRNLEDEQIKEIIKRGGIIGLNFYRDFLNNNGAKADKYDILRHAEHILSLGGENSLAIGTDFDGAEIIDEYNCDNSLLDLSAFFIQNGFSKQITNKIMFNNAYNFFKNLSIEEVQK